MLSKRGPSMRQFKTSESSERTIVLILQRLKMKLQQKTRKKRQSIYSDGMKFSSKDVEKNS